MRIILSLLITLLSRYSVSQNILDSRIELMYPYNLSDFTEITSSKSMHDQPLPFRLPFFGFSYHYVWVQRDGYLTFNKGPVSFKFPIRLPLLPQDPFIEEDPSMIAPWFAFQDIATQVPNAGVYLKVVNLETEKSTELRDRIRLDFKDGMIGSSNFNAKYALIITWRNMTMFNKRPETPLVTNTYQCVLATDEIRTYVMFNYEQIQWITHQDNYEGLQGSAAYVGFNAGNTTRTNEFHPYSQNPRISYLTTRGFGNGLRGRYYFQIDEEVSPGACIEKDLDPNLPDRLPLTFYPKVGHMLGGTLVNITGPCLSPNSIIVCKFGNWKTQGIYRDPNHASCVSPPVMYNGFVDLTITVDDRSLFLGRFYIQPPEIEGDVVVINNEDQLEEINELLELKWKPNNLGWDANSRLTISLWGYRGTDDLYPSLTYIDTLADPGSIRLGQLHTSIDPKLFSNRNNSKTNDITFGFIAINLTDPTVLGKDIKHSPIIWSRPMPLGWYFKKQWEREYGDNGKWKDHFCDNWIHNEPIRNNSLDDSLPQCPCTLNEAMLDRGLYIQDIDCNVIDRKCDTYHRGAQHCFQMGRPSKESYGQTCCYDDYNELMHTGDSMYGGRPFLASPFGKDPFKKHTMIPVLSEWFYEKMPFFFCCKWQSKGENTKTCHTYNQLRKSQDCISYKSPAVASIYGDPHVITFDRHNYTFNGLGEFTLVKVNNWETKFDVQGRFEQLPRYRKTDPAFNATALTAVVARDNISSRVEFRIRPLAASWRYKMYVIVDREYVYWNLSMKYMNFPGVTLYQEVGIQNMSHIIAMFDSGAGLEVMANNGHMSVLVYAPHSFLNKTQGLLGNYSNIKEDDFTLPNGQPISIHSSQEDIHTRFGLEWIVNESSSLFYHDSKPFYYDSNFVPEFGNPPHLPEWAQHLKLEMDSICSDSIACQYDYVVTLNIDYAKNTKYNENYVLYLSNELKRKSVRCPALSNPLNGRKSENRYWSGSIIRFSCDDGYTLIGYKVVRCREDGVWTQDNGDWVVANITDAHFECVKK